MLGDDIVVTVLSVDGDRVKLGIQAPRHVAVLRQEIFEQLRLANTGAALSDRESFRSVAAALRNRSSADREAARHSPPPGPATQLGQVGAPQQIRVVRQPRS
jgi:carbon storage regulator